MKESKSGFIPVKASIADSHKSVRVSYSAAVIPPIALINKSSENHIHINDKGNQPYKRSPYVNTYIPFLYLYKESKMVPEKETKIDPKSTLRTVNHHIPSGKMHPSVIQVDSGQSKEYVDYRTRKLHEEQATKMFNADLIKKYKRANRKSPYRQDVYTMRENSVRSSQKKLRKYIEEQSKARKEAVQ